MFTSLSISGLTVFQLIFAWQMCFAAILVWQNPHSRCLVLFFVFQTLLCLANVLESAGFTLAGYVITPAFTVAMGPVWYLSVRNLIGASTDGLQSARHLLLPLVSLGLTHYVQPLIALGSIMLLGYLVASLKLLRDYRDTVYQVHADAATMDLTWLTRLLGVYAVLSVTDFVRMNVQPITPMPWKAYWYLAHEVGFFGILSVLLVGVIKQPQLFNRLAQYQTLSQRDDAAEDTQLAQSIFAAVDAQVRQQRLFCQPRLSIQHIADQLSLGVKQVSWAINSVSGNNFSNYINEVRLGQVEKQLADPAYAEASVLDIAMNNGFNAKSTFNQAFKTRTGMTPTRFRHGALKN